MAGRPFNRYAVKKCPDQGDGETKCCLVFESAMMVADHVCGGGDEEGPLCGPDNPVSSVVPPGTPRLKIRTDQNGASDRRVVEFSGCHDRFQHKPCRTLATYASDSGKSWRIS